jgi:hypothetical protein
MGGFFVTAKPVDSDTWIVVFDSIWEPGAGSGGEPDAIPHSEARS